MSVRSGHVFISYARADGASLASALYDGLRDLEFEVWLDLHSIPDGSDFDAEIDRGLRSASAVLVVLTPGSVASMQVKSEWSFALNHNLPVLPLLGSECEVPRVLSVLNVLDLRTEPGLGVERLATRLRTLLTDHALWLQERLDSLEKARSESDEPARFDQKIADLRETLELWQGRVDQQRDRIASGMRSVARAVEPTPPADPRSIRIAGTRPQDVTDFFKDRIEMRRSAKEQLRDGKSRLITILGRGGIGKTALACQILREIECGEDFPADRVGSIVYASSTTDGITLERLYFDLVKVVDEPERDRLLRAWGNASLETYERVVRLLEALDDRLHLVLLDNLETVLDSDGRPLDDDLETFFRAVLNTPHDLRLLVTSRLPLLVDGPAARHDLRLHLADGLPPEDATELLRELDPSGTHGLGDATDEELRTVVDLVHGVPRALEIVAGILANDPFVTLEEVVEDFFGRANVLSDLVEENYRRLDADARHVLHALSVFDRPVGHVAVDFLLEPFLPGIDVPRVLSRLVRTHVVTADRRSKTVTLHPIDRSYAYCQLPQEGEYSRDSLNIRAAEFYASSRPDGDARGSALDDLRPRLAEFDHLVKGRAYDEAAVLLMEFGPDMIWGGFGTAGTRMVDQLRERVRSERGRLAVLLCEVARAALLGPVDRAIAFGEETRALADELDERLVAARADYLVSEAHRTMGESAAAIPYLESAAAAFGEVGDDEAHAWCVFRLALSHAYTGQLDEATRKVDDVWRIARRRDDANTTGLAHNALALIALAADETGMAIAHGRAALSAWGREDDRPGGYVLQMLGLAFLRRRDFERAVLHLERARTVAKTIEQPRLEGLARYHTAIAFYLQANLARAEKAAERAASLLEAMNLDAAPRSIVRAIHAAERDDRPAEADALLHAAEASRDCADLYPPGDLAMLAARTAADIGSPDLLRRSVAVQNDAAEHVVRPDAWPDWALPADTNVDEPPDDSPDEYVRQDTREDDDGG